MAVIDVPKPAYMATEELAMFEQSVAYFLRDHATPERQAEWRENGFVPKDLWRKAGEAGLLGASISEKYGGAGGDFRFDAVVMEQLGLSGALNFAIPLHGSVVAPYIVEYGSEEQKSRFLPGVVSGETILAIAMSEPGAGSDLQSMRTRARRDGDSYVIDGQKIFISNGHVASLIIVAAKTNPEAGSKGISLFIIPTDSSGLERGAPLAKLGQGGRDTVELFFNEMRIPVENRLGDEGAGLAMLMNKLPQERLVIAWQAMAMMEAALATTIDYARQRNMFGKRLIDFQNTQFKLAECKTAATMAKVFLYDCTERLLRGALDTATASIAKLAITEAQTKVIDECLQLHGGYGYMSEYPISHMYRDARGYRIYGGTSEIMKLLIARSL